MLKIFFIIALIINQVSPVNAADNKPTYLEEVKDLGYIAGQGLGCRAKKYHNFELLARAILVSKSPNDKAQKEAQKIYNEAKVTSFFDLESNNFAGCDEIVYNFNRQKIFKSMLYSDGKIKLFDGTLITPRKAYDASKLYQKDTTAFAKAHEQYKKYVALVEKNGKNAQKVQFKDANYNKYANQFN